MVQYLAAVLGDKQESPLCYVFQVGVQFLAWQFKSQLMIPGQEIF